MLRELVDWWDRKTVGDYKINLYPDDVRRAMFDIQAIEIMQQGEGGGSGHFLEDFPKARKPAYKLWIDFGNFGVKKSSAQITKLYRKDDLGGRLIVAVTNTSPN